MPTVTSLLRLHSGKSLRFPSASFMKNRNDRLDFVSRLISERNWEELYKVLVSTRREQKRKPMFHCTREHNILHFACQFQPPLFIVKELVSTYPTSVFRKNHMNRFPLHVAVEKGATDKVIEYLLEMNKEAAMMQDIEGKTPLHLLFCDFHKDICYFTYAQFQKVKKAMHFVAWLLCQTAPMSVVVRDIYGRNALEYAMNEKIGHSTIQMLKEVSERVDKKELTKNPLNDHHRQLISRNTKNLFSFGKRGTLQTNGKETKSMHAQTA